MTPGITRNSQGQHGILWDRSRAKVYEMCEDIKDIISQKASKINGSLRCGVVSGCWFRCVDGVTFRDGVRQQMVTDGGQGKGTNSIISCFCGVERFNAFFMWKMSFDTGIVEAVGGKEASKIEGFRERGKQMARINAPVTIGVEGTNKGFQCGEQCRIEKTLMKTVNDVTFS